MKNYNQTGAKSQEGHFIVTPTGGGGRSGSIVWGLGFWLGKLILGFFRNIDFDNI